MRTILLIFAGAAALMGQSVSIGSAVFTGSGLNDATSGGTYSGVAANHLYTATICAAGSPDTVRFARDGGAATGCQSIVSGAMRLSYPASTLSAASWATGRATFTDSGHGLSEGALVTITGASPSGYNVTNAAVHVISSSQFSVALASNPGTYTSGGTVLGNDSFTITWAATTGHTTGDSWSVAATANGSVNAQSFVQRGIGATVARNVQDKLREIVSVGDFDAKGDGVTDDSGYIQSTLDAACASGGTINFPVPKSYYLITKGLQISGCKNIVLRGSAGTEIRVKAGYVDTPYNASWPTFGQDSILRIVDSTNITVDGLTLNGNISNRTANAGAESENCDILIAGSTNITVKNAVLKEAMTDGVLITADGSHNPSKNVWIVDSQITAARRNNISGAAQFGLWIRGNTITDAGTIQGISPKAGIGIEPDYIASPVLSKDVHIEENTVTGSAGTYAIYAGGLGTNGLTIARNDVHDNSGYGIDFESSTAGYSNSNSTCSENKVHDNTGGIGIRVVQRNLDKMTNNIIRNNIGAVFLYAPDGLLIDSNIVEGNLNQSIVVDPAGPFVNLSIKSNTFRDNYSATGVANGAFGWVFQGTAASSTAMLAFDGNLMYGSSGAAYLQQGLSITGACQCRGSNNTAFNLSNPTLTFAGILGSGNHNYDLTGSLAVYADQSTSGANFSPNNGGGLLRVAERLVTGGSGSPNGAVTADPGSLYIDTLAGTLYRKDSGTGTNTGWVVSSGASGVASGIYGDGTHVGQFQVDAEGRITSAGNIPFANSGVTAGIYGDGTHVGQFQVDAMGRVTSAATLATQLATKGSTTAGSTTGITVATTCTSSAVPSGGGTPTITCTSTVTDAGHSHTQN